MSSLCFSCYDSGLESFIESRRHRISQVTADTYLSDGRRFKNYFYEGSMKVKGSWVSTTARGRNGRISYEDVDVFLDALASGGMAMGSVSVYRTPIEGALRFAPRCEHVD